MLVLAVPKDEGILKVPLSAIATIRYQRENLNLVKDCGEQTTTIEDQNAFAPSLCFA